MKHISAMALCALALCTGTLVIAPLSGVQEVAYAATVQPTPFLYRVDAGDQLSYLAKVYGSTVAAIMSASGLHTRQLHAGQVLTIPIGADQTGRVEVNTPPFARPDVKLPTRDFVATAYDACAACNGPWGAVDYFGNPLRFGDVAVDPTVIPLGTKLFISGYDDPALPKGGFYATAVDTGGAIVGNRIDIFMPVDQQAENFGIEHVQVTVVR